jgi:L-alanine-DL-glutamate epimerase-like enolase superfamily enzyme
MPQSYLERIELELLRVPLKNPYKLVFGRIEAFDTLLVTVTFADGRSGVGDATILTGYTEETLDQCWQAARAIGSEMPGVRVGDVNDHLASWLSENPFTVTAFRVQLDQASTPRLDPDAVNAARVAREEFRVSVPKRMTRG